MKTEKDTVGTVAPNEMTLVERVKAPTPKFFKMLRGIGLGIAAAGAAVLVSPIALPAAVVAAAGYLTLAGGVMTAVSQTAVDSGPGAATNEGT